MVPLPVSKTGWLLLALLIARPLTAEAGGVRFLESEPTPESATAIAISPDGEHLYVTGDNDVSLTVHATDNMGQVAPSLLQTIPINDATSVVVSGDGEHVYVTFRSDIGFPDGGLRVFKRDLITGLLTLLETQQDGLNMVPSTTMRHPQGVIVSPDGAHVYIVTNADNSVVAFTRDENPGPGFGMLTYLQVQQQTPGSCDLPSGICGLGDARTMTMDADGESLYTGGKKGDAKSGVIAVFTRDDDTMSANFGKLAFVETIRNLENGITSLHRPSALVLDADGEHLYATSQGGKSLHVFARDAGDDGKLTVVEFYRDGSLTKGLKGATGVAIDAPVAPAGGYVYVTGAGDDALSVFRRDDVTGKLTILETQFNELDPLVAGLHGFFGPQDLQIASNGLRLYVALRNQAVMAFTVDVCGDGTRGSDEQCDDGCAMGMTGVCEPVDDGDGCSSSCRIERCVTPATQCTTTHNALPDAATLSIKNDPLAEDSKDQLQWKWGQGTVALNGFEDPRDTTTYVLCVYDSLAQPVMVLAAPDGNNDDCKKGDHCWRSSPGPSSSTPHVDVSAVKQFKYGDKSFTPDGIDQLQLKTGVGNASLKLKAKGVNLHPPVLPPGGLALPVTVVMKNTDSGECWSATYDNSVPAANRILANDGTQFKAKNSN